jgi:uncharacterized protein (DUF58 family)
VRWLESADQARLKGLSFSPRRAAPAASPGRHRSAARGYSREFDAHRPYAPGDEARAIDWKAYARLDRYFVREHQSEDRLSLMILLDASASMDFAGPGRPAKFDTARRAAAGLCWLALEQGDAAGLMVVGGAQEKSLPPRSGAVQLTPFTAALDGAATAASTGLASRLEAAAARLPPRAAVLLLSDLMGDTAAILKALRGLTAGRRELLVLRIIDPAERDLSFDGPVKVRGLEGGELVLDAAAAAAAYREAFDRQDGAYRAALSASGARYAVAVTDAPWTAAAARILRR